MMQRPARACKAALETSSPDTDLEPQLRLPATAISLPANMSVGNLQQKAAAAAAASASAQRPLEEAVCHKKEAEKEVVEVRK